MKIKTYSLLLIVLAINLTIAKETITFPSKDSLTITADLYLAHDKSAPFIILFHQASWSRGEYLEIAPKLNAMGFNCIAVDQRSGGEINNIKNQTKLAAEKAGKGTEFLDAYQDLEASVDYVRRNYAKGKLIVWGSSYSAALMFVLTANNPGKIDALLSFAPGEYYGKRGKSKTYIAEHAAKINKHVFITSAKDEKPRWINIYNSIPSKDKHMFVPKTAGNHGSRALWNKFGDSKDYWKEVKEFLSKYFVKK